MPENRASFEPIAVVGSACLLPGARSPAELHAATVAGADLLTAAPAGHWRIDPALVLTDDPEDYDDHTWTDRGGYVSGFEALWSPQGFNLPAEDLAPLDPLVHWVLHTAREALRSAGCPDVLGAQDRAGAIFGNLSYPSASLSRLAEAIWLQRLGQGFLGGRASEIAGIARPHPLNRFMSGLPAHLLAQAVGLDAGALSLDAACSSSLYSLKLACDRLHDRRADLMLAGGVNRADDLFIHIGFCSLQAMSRSGRSRPFHRDADGLVPAEGAAFVALKRLDDAVAAGDRVLGVIRGVGLSNDGRGKGMLAPCPRGQARALRQAYAVSGVTPASIGLLECHATGTPVGDVAEIQSAAEIFADLDDLPLGSLKSNLGHLITASGVAGLIKVLGAMEAGVRPPTLHAEQPLAAFEGTPLRPLHEAEPWPAPRDGPRRAALSNFGFGGNDAHVIVEQHEPQRLSVAVPVALRPSGELAIVAAEVIAADASGLAAFDRALFGAEPRLTDEGGVAGSIELPLTGLKFPPKDLDQTLAQQLLILRAALTINAKLSEPLPAERTGVLVGMQCDAEVGRYGARLRLPQWARDWAAAEGLTLPEGWLAEARQGVGSLRQAAGVVGAMPNIPANRINSQLDLGGPSFTVSSEELSGVDALELACRALRAGELDAALVGAVDLCCEPVQTAVAKETLRPALHVPGDAAVLLVVKRLDDARQAGDPVLALIPDEPPGDQEREREPALKIGPDSDPLTPRFGHAHAASGLLQVTAAALACHHRASPGALFEAPTPWWPDDAPRQVQVRVEALGDRATTVTLREDVEQSAAPLLLQPPPLVQLYVGANREALLRRVESAAPGGEGPARLCLVARPEELDARRARAVELLAATEDGVPAAEGVYFNEQPLGGELGFVFTGPAGVYPGMGRELLLGLPELLERLYARCRCVEQTGRWVFDPDATVEVGPHEKLWGSSFLAQLHSELSLGLLGLRPQAALGFCSGETNALFALGAWQDMDTFFPELLEARVFSHEISGDFDTVARAWRDQGLPGDAASWKGWRVLAPQDEVLAATAAEPLCHLTIISAPGDVVIGGAAEACQRVVERIGKSRCYPLGYDVAIHCPEMAAFSGPWRELHHRETRPVEGVRFYTSATCSSYEATADAAADALTGMAATRVDFPAVIQRAWQDGVRVFVEHGPRDGCTKWIDAILGPREHLAVALDRGTLGGRTSLDHAVHAAAQLAAAGVEVDVTALNARLQAGWPDAPVIDAGKPTRTYPAHPEPVVLPPLRAAPVLPAPQIMAPAPALPPVASVAAAPVPPPPPPPQQQQQPQPQSPVAGHAWLSAAHQDFLQTQADVHQQFLQQRLRALDRLQQAAGAPAQLQGTQLPLAQLQTKALPGPAFDRAQLEVLATGKISSVFGELFQQQDHHERQVRLPEPPLLLVDRVTGIAGEPGSMGKGTIWTETDVRRDGWYLNDDHTMPAGIVVESGQADLLLISWLGIDFLNQGERVYRLLGCELTNHGTLPRPGETLCYKIHVDGHARAGDVRLFFFHYDCWVNGELRLSVRNAQAGFFTNEELDDSGGVLWTPEEAVAEIKPVEEARVDPPAVRCTRRSFSEPAVRAFSEGDVVSCFGAGYELTRTHTRTPKIQSGRMRLLQEVTAYDPQGGPWGRGYLRVENDLRDDDWYLQGHFKNDPCMPGTLMCEGCLQAMAFYLTAQGYTLERDGWRFDPIPDEMYKLQCRGQVTPGSRELTYEVFVEEVIDGPVPMIFADILGSSDGLKIFHGRRMGLRLIPDWPMTSMPELLEGYVEPKPVAHEGDFPFDYRSLLSCAWGKPSEAFGAMALPFDWTRHIARLPGPPYHFMSRVTRIEGEMGSMKTGAWIELEYDIPPDAWYFDENGARLMPYAVLLEAVLQPCGWLAVYIGCPGGADVDLFFRNLDGTGTVHVDLPPEAGTLRTKTTLRSISKMGQIILVSFDVECFVGEVKVYTLDTGFGFFPGSALVSQVGLPVSDEQRAALAQPSDFSVDLKARPARYCAGPLRLPAPMLLMLDRVTGYWPEGGAAGLGRMRAEKDVDMDEWFFKAHFFQDPVQPGSLGLEAMIQLLQFYMIHEGMAQGMACPRFEPIATERPFTWRYRGQVTPQKERISVEVELLERGTDDRGAYVVASSSMWVDGLRIYDTPNLAIRVVEGAPEQINAPSPPARPNEELLDPEVDTWLQDHRPNWTLPTLPLMSMLDRLAAAAQRQAPGQVVVGAKDVRVTGWLIFDGPRRLRTSVDGDRAKLEVWREAAKAELSRFQPVSEGRVLLAEGYGEPPAPLPPLFDAQPVEQDPYEAGMLFHGPAFHLLKQLSVGSSGSSAILDAGAGDVPPGLLNQALLDAAVHGILHDELHRWSADIPERQIAYPYRVIEARFFGPAPLQDEVRCETRLVGFDDGALGAEADLQRFPRFQIQLIVGQRVWLDLQLTEVLIPMGPHADDRQKRIDFRERRFLPGAGLSRFEGDDGATRLTRAEVRSRDWLRGSVAWAYEAAAQGDDLVRELAVKDHIAQRAQVHPALVTVAEDLSGGRPAHRPLTRYPVSVTWTDAKGEAAVTDAGAPTLDLDFLRTSGRRVSHSGAWIGEDFSLGLCRRFVGALRVDDPQALAAVSERGVLYLGNHQAQIESMLFPMVATAHTGVHVVTIAKVEHRTAWIGPLSRFSYAYPGVELPRVIIYFDQSDPKSMFGILEELKQELTKAGRSIFVHVEGQLGLRCRLPVEKLSSVFIDLAQKLEVPIVPVRLAGALPVEAAGASFDFPLGYARQDYYLGRPVLPQELADLPYAERRTHLLAAINGVGPGRPLAAEEPNDPDPAFTERVRAWRQRLDLPEVQAVVLAILEETPEPSDQTRLVLEAVEAGEIALPDDQVSRWLGEVVRWLCGGRVAVRSG
jgi:acyl transferase domain-containing protein/3-hydroxymyristoyl/3-hydroxydecanoyl-(acyl carrier protein) dehydratase/1-acyl-sn-glycerol-3-phosphate acyltransferase